MQRQIFLIICLYVCSVKSWTDNVPEMFSEATKAIGSMGDLNHQPSIDYLSNTHDYAVANSCDVSVALATAVYKVSNCSVSF